jgi:hypothetical protein
MVLELLRSGADIHAFTEDEFASNSNWTVERGGVTPVHAAIQVEKELIEKNEPKPEALLHVIKAAEPWSPANHRLFDARARRNAYSVFRLLSNTSIGVDAIIVSHILPYLIHRLAPPLSRSEANTIALDLL